jgi:DMSO reductase anchor subunit
MIYRIKARTSWNKKETTNIFFNVGYIGALLVGAILIASENYQSAFIVVPFGAFIGFLQYSIFKNEVEFYTNLEENNKNFYQLNKTKKLYENNFAKLRDYRAKTLILGAFILPILSMLLLASQSFSSSLIVLIFALIISFSSEIISRLLFYKTAVSLGIAGNFFMGNQR